MSSSDDPGIEWTSGFGLGLPGPDSEELLNIAGLQLMSFNFFNKGGAVQMEQFGGLIFNPFCFLKGLQYQGFFKFGYSTVQAYAFIRYFDG